MVCSILICLASLLPACLPICISSNRDLAALSITAIAAIIYSGEKTRRDNVPSLFPEKDKSTPNRSLRKST